MPEPAIEFRRILRLLNENGARYVVIGGVALHLHGGDNQTFDADFSFEHSRDNAHAISAALSGQNARYRGFPPDLPCVIDAQAIQNSTNITLQTDIGNIDFLAQPEGIDSFEGLWQRSVVMEIDGMPVHVASLDDLIAMKRAAGRPKDLTHIMTIEALKKLLRES